MMSSGIDKLARVALAGAVVGAALCGQAWAQEMALDFHRRNMSLNGKWEVLKGHANAKLWRPPAARKSGLWSEASVPGDLLGHVDRKKHPSVKCVWARRSFALTDSQATGSAVLKWNHIAFGARAWINGKQVAYNPNTGPHTALIGREVLRTGRNEIVLKVTGWAGVPKSKSGFPLVPTGASVAFGGKAAAILGDVYLEFYDRAYLKSILAVPDVRNGKVTFRMWLDSAARMPETLDLSVRVTPTGSEQAGVTASTVVKPSGRVVDLTVALPEAKLWTPQTPHLYTARLLASSDGQLCDNVSFNFGMREIRVAGGRYQLNGRPLWLRGSNLLCEWLWGEKFNRDVKRYLVDEARAMNLNSFRTHTYPPATLWADTADRHGMMFLAEMPVLYNWQDFRFTKAEYDIWHKNVLLDASAWIRKLWNHPSVVMWVLSNESRFDNKWEAGPYRDTVVALDPTRPTMRTFEIGTPRGTKENLDLHICANWARGPEGHLIAKVVFEAGRRDPTRTLTNTEYMNWLASRERMELKWLGRKGHPGLPLEYADFAAEHTEAMRRLGYDGIMPYMYAGWTHLGSGKQWRPGFPTPMAAALHSSMSPVLASLDLFDRNFVTGQTLTTPLCLINELHEDVDVRIDVYLTPKNPLIVPDKKALVAGVWHTELERTLKADSLTTEQLRWEVPDKAGRYWLAVVTSRKGAKPVVSQRVVRAAPRVDSATMLKGRKIVILSGTKVLQDWLTARGAVCSSAIPKEGVETDVIVIWDAAKLTKTQLAGTSDILKCVRAGGRLVVVLVDRAKWTWDELLDFDAISKRSMLDGPASRAFPYRGVEHQLLAGVDRENLKRWNGVPGTISDGWIEGKILVGARKLLWRDNPEKTTALSVKVGKGEAIISLLQVTQRFSTNQKDYDPTAERILVNMLAAGSDGE